MELVIGIAGAVLTVLLSVIWRLRHGLRAAKARGDHFAAIASEYEARSATVADLLRGNSYHSGVTLRWHVQRLRMLARVLAEEGTALLDRRPEIAWQLRALDDYLQGIAAVATGDQLLDVRLQLDRHGCLYEETYMPLAQYIERADI